MVWPAILKIKLKSLYQARKKYLSNSTKLKPDIKKSLLDRYDRESVSAVQYLNDSGTQLANASTTNQQLKSGNNQNNVLIDNTKTTIIASSPPQQLVKKTGYIQDNPQILEVS